MVTSPYCLATQVVMVSSHSWPTALVYATTTPSQGHVTAPVSLESGVLVSVYVAAFVFSVKFCLKSDKFMDQFLKVPLGN